MYPQTMVNFCQRFIQISRSQSTKSAVELGAGYNTRHVNGPNHEIQVCEGMQSERYLNDKPSGCYYA